MRSQVTLTRLEPATRLALERAAAEDGRTISAMIAKILTDWLKSQDWGEAPTRETER